jgi:DNA-binding MarR family transcriptional regulator
MTDETLQLISLLERLHRRVLHIVKVELEALGVLDISNVQAIMLLQIADADVTIGELALRASPLLSNLSYNVKRMMANGYLVQKRSKHELTLPLQLNELSTELGEFELQ